MTAKRPTLKTISEMSGFAVTTVSRALSDGPEIGEKTKHKVRAIAKELGYVRNRSGVGLVTGRSNVISLVLSADHDVVDEHTGRLIASVARNLQGTLYHMNIVTYASKAERLREVMHVVETLSADAVILNQIEPEDERITYLIKQGFPFVAYGQSDLQDDHPYFDFDNITFGEQAAQALLEKGRRHLLAIAPPADQTYSKHMLSGLKRALVGQDAHLEILAGATSHDGNEAMHRALTERLASSEPVDAIIAPSTASAVVSIAALEQNNLLLGSDVDIFAKDASPYLKYIRREVMSVYEDLALAGAFLAKAAVQAIEKPDAAPMQRVEAATPHYQPE